jgi:hypothetical protein
MAGAGPISKHGTSLTSIFVIPAWLAEVMAARSHQI